MPAGPRIRSNSEFGLTTDAPLTAGATTFNSARLSLMPVVSSAHAVVTLDPRALTGEPEIVVITAHTAAATVATITRGQYGTVARSHAVGTEWIHAPIDEDFIEIVTAATRPSNPYEGQFIFETDTNKLVGYGGVDWAPRDAGGYLGHTFNAGAVAVVGAGPTDLASVTVTVGSGRRIKITGFGNAGSTVATDVMRMKINEGASVLSLGDIVPGAVQATTGNIAINVWTIETPSAGSHTYKIVGERVAGSGTITFSSNLGFKFITGILVEDIGAA